MYVAVDFNGGIKPKDVDVAPTTFKALNLQERHLEEFIRRNINRLFEDDETLLMVGQQVQNVQRGISDLTAVDADGNIVLIEIKRDLDDITGRKEPFEFQAIRYAASYAKIKTPDELVERVFSAYIEQHRDESDLGSLTPTEKARRELNQFLVSNDALKTFNRIQRILLVASAFDPQTLSAVAWLISNGVDISCIAVTPVHIGSDGFLQIEKVLPPSSLNDFYVDLAAPKNSSGVAAALRSSSTSKPRQLLPRMSQLFEWGLISAGDPLRIKNYDNSEATALNDKDVRYQDRELSYSSWGKEVTGWSAINVYEWTIPRNETKTLHELRAEKMAELEASQAEFNGEDD